MPEIPDLEGYRAYFNRRLPGVKVAVAAVTIPIVVLFFFFERFLTRGLTAGAVKG